MLFGHDVELAGVAIQVADALRVSAVPGLPLPIPAPRVTGAWAPSPTMSPSSWPSSAPAPGRTATCPSRSGSGSAAAIAQEMGVRSRACKATVWARLHFRWVSADTEPGAIS
jgi:hypothetical protein